MTPSSQQGDPLKVQQIKKALAEPVTSVQVNNTGWTNEVYEVNNKWIFRFPRTQESRGQMEIEKQFLPELQKKVEILVPIFEFEEADFVGYRKIPGIPIKLEHYEAMNEAQKDTFAAQLTDFIKVIHQWDKKALHFPDWSKNTDLIKDVLPAVLPRLDASVGPKVLEACRNFEGQKHEITKVVSHSDIRPDHVLIEPESLTLTGIIDFGDLSIDDPAGDFSGFLSDGFGEDLLNRMMKAYGTKEAEAWKARAVFYAKTYHLYSIYWGSQLKRDEQVAISIKALEEIFSDDLRAPQ